MPDGDRLLLIDVSGLIYRSFFALPPLMAPSGAPTGALFGFIRSFLKVYKKVEPTLVVAIFDGPDNKKSRLALYPAYKATRKPTPPDLIAQIHEAHTFCHLWGIPELSLPGVEADDTIAAVTAWATAHTTGPIFICSADKDLAQLVQPRVVLIRPGKEDVDVDEEGVRREWGLAPSQMCDFFALVGDASDNVPGIEGVGPKTALELLSTWKTLGAILENADTIPGKKGERIRSGRESALISRQLVALDTSLPVPQDRSAYVPKGRDEEALRAYFATMGFKTLEPLLQSTTQERAECSFGPFDIVQSAEQLAQFLSWLEQQDSIAIDTETTSLDEWTAELVGIGIASPSRRTYIALNKGLEPRDVVQRLTTVIQTHHIGLTGHNIKYDLHVLSRYGFPVPTPSFDTLIASWLLNAHERTHSLDELSRKYLGLDKAPIETLLGKGKTAKTMADIPVEEAAKHCAEDIECTLQLKTLFEKELASTGVSTLFHDVEMALIPVLVRMENVGVFVNVHQLKALHHSIEQSIHAVEQDIFALAGKEFVINSPKQLSDVLFTDLGLPKRRSGKKFLSTRADIMEELSLTHPIAQKVLEYRQLEKLRSTYLEALPRQIRADGRVHCHFVQSGTATGRLACQEPNLQNIPVRTELGKEIRAAFGPEKRDWVYISADYSQIELRLLAHMTQDPLLLSSFKNDLDIHAMTASELYDVPVDQVTEEMRRQAKAVNFGILYGQQAFGLSRELHISTAEAQRIIDRYFARYPSVQTVLETIKKKAHATGQVETLTGRRRILPDINSPDFITRSAQERLAINTPFQGTAADIIKMAMISIDRWLIEQQMQTKMVLQIHDELLFEAPTAELAQVLPVIRSMMESAMDVTIPLRVEISVGKNWREC